MRRIITAETSALAGILCVLAACVATPMGRSAAAETDIDRARVATRAEDWTQAGPRWHRIFLRHTDAGVEACREAARAMIELNDAESARSVLNVGLERYPGDPDLHELYGNVLARLGFRRAAEGSYLRALAIQSDRPSTLLELGRLRIGLNLHAAALSALKRRIALGASDSETYYLAGEAYRACGQYADAYRAYEHSFARDGVPTTQLVRAASLYDHPAVRDRLPGAASFSRLWLERALEHDPQHTFAHYLLAVIYEDTGSSNSARAQYKRSVETDPACLQSLHALARFLFEQGDLPAARDVAKRALELETSPARRVELQRIVAG